ncbi:MAG TPA: hypothetical protein PKY77_02680 [Phycisphaerae bacterium]|nr:hypothetical protein [Phycisphaerae bacterium]HRY66650.1 hypothetical protein [Phycisphaerae bacterium]HSA27647.1 hypothetical protein [Phycisphaerae bacterium]
MTKQEPRRRLSSLRSMELSPDRQVALEGIVQACPDDRNTPWGRRKPAEVTNLLRLDQLAPPGRMVIRAIDASGALRIALALRVKCPAVRPDGQIYVADQAELGIILTDGCLRGAKDSVAVLVFAPALFHSNAAPPGQLPIQGLCLGDASVSMPVAALGCAELVLLLYSILQLQTVTIDPEDPLRVANPEAARYWLAHRDQMPLDRTPFLAPVEYSGGATP